MAAMVCTGAAERAKPSAADIERALAGFRGFVEEGDDSSMYLEPLREFLMAEGDIAGELEMTEEHLKKLKFNFTESFTKRLFVEAVNNGQIDESAEQSAELDIKIANAKKQSKIAQQQKDEAVQSIVSNFAPAVASRYAQLDEKRTRFQDELGWLDKQDKENLAAGYSIQPKSKEGCLKALEDQEELKHKLRNDVRKMTERKAQLQADIGPLEKQSSVLSAAVSELNRHAGGSQLAEGFKKQEIYSWYTALASALSAQTGLKLQLVSDGTVSDKRKKVAITLQSFYTGAPTGDPDSSAMSLDIPEEAPSTEPVLCHGTHTLNVTYDVTGTELASVTMTPADVPIEDLVAHGLRTNNLRFLVRELRSRIGNYYCRRDEISTIGNSQPGGIGSIAVREEAHGLVSMALPNGLRCILSVGHDYPREHAVLRIMRWEDDGGRTPLAVMEQLKGSPPGASDASLTEFCEALKQRAQELQLM